MDEITWNRWLGFSHPRTMDDDRRFVMQRAIASAADDYRARHGLTWEEARAALRRFDGMAPHEELAAIRAA